MKNLIDDFYLLITGVVCALIAWVTFRFVSVSLILSIFLGAFVWSSLIYRKKGIRRPIQSNNPNAPAFYHRWSSYKLYRKVFPKKSHKI